VTQALPNAHRWIRWTLLLLLVPLFLRAETDAQRAAKGGELRVVKRHRVLHLYGKDAKARGFAHGYLLAPEIRDTFDAAMQSLPNFGVSKFENTLVPWSRRNFAWDADARDELEGIYDGMAARLGKDGLQPRALDRPFTRDDLVAMNVIADWFGPACSGFSAWDKRTPSGEVVHGRTLDFPLGPTAIANQIILACDPLPDRGRERPAQLAWVGVGWPGSIGQYTGMNSAGLVACIHDPYNVKRGPKDGDFVARGLLLRRMLETVDPAAKDPADQAAALVAVRSVGCGNLFHLTWPRAVAEKLKAPPSAIIEVDGSERQAQIARMDDTELLVLTNHFRLRSPPIPCARFKSITDAAALLQQSGKTIGLTEARKLLMSAEQSVAAHSVYFYPDTMMLHVALTRNNVMSPRVAPTEFTWKELFARNG
jgi:hypothetical protein